MNDQYAPSLELLTEAAVSAARAAGAVLLSRWKRSRRIQFKGEIDLVTDADRRSEETIVSLLQSQFPDHQILAEEGSTGGSSGHYRWIIDPLDGTTNYAHGYPHFAVSIALEQAGEIALGVVYDPILRELFVGRKGQGATLNGQPLRVSSIDRLLRALGCTGFPYDRSKFGATLHRWEYFVRRLQGVRRDGSAALDICYVAAGRFDVFWEDHLSPWDAAAAILIVLEAGGRVTNFQGGAPDIYRGDILATNGLLHSDMLEGLLESRLVPDEGGDEGDAAHE
jgi:myo-inositol-1(or 4)-monophosphatase